MNSKSIFAIAVTASAIALNVRASTVAYWPLAYENGVRTKTSDSFVDIQGGLVARPISMYRASIVDVSDYCPLGTNGFPVGFGVWDPQSQTQREFSTALRFANPRYDGNAGALKVANPTSLRLSTFTFETFVRMTGNGPSGWGVIAVMPVLRNKGPDMVVNFDSWALRVTSSTTMTARFTKSGAADSDASNVGSYNKSVEFATPGLYDGNWHHVALVVKEKSVSVYFDYRWANGATLDEAVYYPSAEESQDLYIGSTPQTAGAFGGHLAHMRISDVVLDVNTFLQPSCLQMRSGEIPGTILHADFEAPDELPPMTGGKALLNWAGAESLERTLNSGLPFVRTVDGASMTVYAAVTNSTGVANTSALTNVWTSSTARSYVRFAPEKDDFTNTSFTVECFYKTRQATVYVPLVRRRGGSNVQFNLGFGGTAGQLSAMVHERYQSGDGAKRIDDTEATNDGTWHHAALVVDADRKTAALYRDRKKIGEQLYNGRLVPGTTPVCIAGIDNGNAYNGYVDNVRIVMRALGPEEFLSSSNVDASAKTVAWLGFEDGLSARAGDSALKSPVASAATEGGAVPSVAATDKTGRITDVAENVLRTTNEKCAVFDKGVVKFGADPYLALLNDFTVEFYVKSGANDPYAGIIRCNANTDGSVPAWALSYGDKSSPSTTLIVRAAICWPQAIDVNRINEDTGIVIGDGRWHHIAMTVEQGANSVVMKIYKDHATTPSWTRETTGRIYYGTTQGEVWLGASSSTTAFFCGALDEVRISKGVLPHEEFLKYTSRGMVITIR